MADMIDVDVHPAYPVSWQAAAFNGLLRGTMKPISTILLRNTVSMHVANRLFALSERVPGRLPGHVSIASERIGSCAGEWVRGAPINMSAQGDLYGDHGASPNGGPSSNGGPSRNGDAGHSGSVHSGTGEGGLDEGKVMLYFHGGAYFICSPATHRAVTWRLSSVARRPVLALDYRQGPVHSLAESLADAIDAYQCLLDRGYAPRDILLAGDSAGGHLTLATLLALRDRGIALPAAAVCMSPWTDLSGDRRQANGWWQDPMLPASRIDWVAKRWTAGLDRRDPLVSPVYGDYSGIPPLMIVTGSTEVLRDEGRRVALSARENGVPVTYEEWNRMPHAFGVFADVLPEARLLFMHIARFLKAVEARAAGSGAAVA